MLPMSACNRATPANRLNISTDVRTDFFLPFLSHRPWVSEPNC